MTKRTWALLAGAAVAGIAGGGAAAVAAGTTAVAIQNFSYQPPSVTVAAGTTVTWTNQDTAPHSVTADAGSFDSSPGCGPSTTQSCLAPGAAFSHTFTTPGTYQYHCKVHSFMHGTVVVTGAAAAPPSPAAAPTTTVAPPVPAAASPGAAPAPASASAGSARTTGAGSVAAATTPRGTTTPGGATLPFTGSHRTLVLALVGAALVVAGAALRLILRPKENP